MSSLGFDEVLDRLLKIPFFGKSVGHKNIIRLYEELDNKYHIHDYLMTTKIIHVAGTNGKGSVCRFLKSIYNAEGYKVGMFTSPHIDHITERIDLNDGPISESFFIESFIAVETIVNALEKEGIFPTFFEWLFAMFMYCVKKEGCELLIIEVGIGGRLDTTNILKHKDIAVITAIGLDHQNILGNTIYEIAGEKAGIIQENIPVVTGNTDEALIRIQEECAQKESQLYCVKPFTKLIHNISKKKIDFSIYNKYYYYENMHLKLTGLYQFENLNLALTVVEILKDKMPVALESLYLGVEKFYNPGRFDVIQDKLILDGAHNQLGVNSLIETLKHVYKNSKFDILVGVKEGKDYEGILRTFIESQMFEVFYVCQESFYNSVDITKVKDVLSRYDCEYVVIDNLEEFIKERIVNTHEKILLGAGSLYLMSQLREMIERGGFTYDSI